VTRLAHGELPRSGEAGAPPMPFICSKKSAKHAGNRCNTVGGFQLIVSNYLTLRLCPALGDASKVLNYKTIFSLARNLL
jgi:hypothetical protein